MTAGVVYARLRVTDPSRWRAVALAWRRWAALAGGLVAELSADLARVGRVWSGAAARAAAAALAGLRQRLLLFRVLCWRADQAASEFAASLERARLLLARAFGAAARSGLTIDDDGGVSPAARPSPVTAGNPQAAVAIDPRPHPVAAADPRPHAVAAADPRPHAVATDPAGAVAADLAAAIGVADRADAAAAERLEAVVAAIHHDPTALAWPDCAASPAAVRAWWCGLTPGERELLLATEPAALAGLDGLPAADRDAANRLLLDERRAELDRALAMCGPGARGRLRELRRGLDALADRLAAGDTRAYLLRLDLSGEGRTVIALGDPDRAANVVTHVPGMTADLASFPGELGRAARVADRATELTPAAPTSAVLWLDYDAPDFVDEAASPRRAEAGAATLRRFQDGLRAAHEGPPARQTLVGHSYGSLVVGTAARTSALADEIVFVGSPGVGVDAAGDLAVPPDRVWSSTSRGDVIQYAAVSPSALVRDLALAGPLLAALPPERDLWFGHNPSDPGFGARVFASDPGAGHLGYWDRGSPSLDTMASIAAGTLR